MQMHLNHDISQISVVEADFDMYPDIIRNGEQMGSNGVKGQSHTANTLNRNILQTAGNRVLLLHPHNQL